MKKLAFTIVTFCFMLGTVEQMLAQNFPPNFWWVVKSGTMIMWNGSSDRQFGAWFGDPVLAYTEGAGCYSLGPYRISGLMADVCGVRSFYQTVDANNNFVAVQNYWQGSLRRDPLVQNTENFPSTTSQVALFPHPSNKQLLYFATPQNFSEPSWYGGYNVPSVSVIDLQNRRVSLVVNALNSLYALNPFVESATEMVSAVAIPEQQVVWLVYVYRVEPVSVNSMVFYTFRIDRDSIHTQPVRSVVTGRADTKGKLTFSVDGLMASIGNKILSFDPANGTFGHLHTLNAPNMYNNPAFSAKGKFVWVPAYKIGPLGDTVCLMHQFDITYPTDTLKPVATISMVPNTWYSPGGYVPSALGPDCRLYFSMNELVFCAEHPDEIARQNDTLFRQELWDNGATARRTGFGGMPDLVNQLSFPKDTTSCLWPKAEFTLDTVCLASCATVNNIYNANVDTWLWNFPGGTPAVWNYNNPPCIKYDVAGEYDVQLIIGNSFAVDTIHRKVKINSHPQVSAGPDISVCIGDTVTLTAIGARTYEWFPTDGLQSPNSGTTRLVPTQDVMTFIVHGIDANGCDGLDTITVTRGAIVARVSGDTSICRGQSTVLRASGGSQFRWLVTNGIDSVRNAIVNASPQTTTSYAVEVISGQCTDTAFITVAVHDKPVIGYMPDRSVCEGGSITIMAPVTGATDALIEWINLTDSTHSIGNELKIYPENDALYKIIASTPNGCKDSATFTVRVGVPFRSITIDTALCPGQPLQFEELIFMPSADTAFMFIHQSADSCYDTVNVTIRVEVPQLEVNNAPRYCTGDRVLLNAVTNCRQVTWHDLSGVILAQGTSFAFAADTSRTLLCKAVTDAGCETEDTAYVVVIPKRDIYIRHSSASSFVGSAITTQMTVTASANTMPLNIVIPSNWPGLIPISVSGGTIINDGSNGQDPILQIDSSGIANITWQSYLSAKTAYALDAEPQIQTDECTQVFVEPGQVSIEGCALALRNIQLANITRLTIFDVTGRLVSDIPVEHIASGLLLENEIPPGMYFARIQWGTYEEVRNVYRY